MKYLSKFYILLAVLAAGLLLTACVNKQLAGVSSEVSSETPSTGAVGERTDSVDEAKLIWHLKAVPVDVSLADLDYIAARNFKVLMPEWGLDDVAPAEVKRLLGELEKRNLKIILDAGFSAAAWGYREDGTDPPDQRPVWQKERVASWMRALKDSPAIYGWDISNEAGENIPNGDKFRISLEQMTAASRGARAIDPGRPVVMRMHYWDEYDGDFDWKNPFAAGIADIVVLNLYSNYSEDGLTALSPEMIIDSAEGLIDKIKKIDPQARIWLSLAAFQELPIFILPTASGLKRDIDAAVALDEVESVGFFGWELDDWELKKQPLLLAVIEAKTGKE